MKAKAKKGAQASRLSLQARKNTRTGKDRAIAKATGKMPVLPYKITSTGKLIDDPLEAVEKENPKLKNVLNKNYTQLQIDPANLMGLIDLIATIPFQHADLHAKDILGHFHVCKHGHKEIIAGECEGKPGEMSRLPNL